jgi:hypothetical protein
MFLREIDFSNNCLKIKYSTSVVLSASNWLLNKTICLSLRIEPNSMKILLHRRMQMVNFLLCLQTEIRIKSDITVL